MTEVRGDASRASRGGGGLPRPVWMLGWVSFFTDLASEMIYPLLPLFLTRVLGAGAMSLGVIEGIAEAANSALKVISGRVSDVSGSPKPLVVGGYGLSSLARPMIAVATTWPAVLGIRFVDRLGKGIRGAPRDAMLAEFAPAGGRGRVYGFHRAMDHAGAVAGPLIASAFLFFWPGEYRTLFALTIVPGIVVIVLLLRVPNPRAIADRQESEPGADRATAHLAAAAPGRRGGWGMEQFDSRFWKAMAVILVFSIGNASDAFLLLRLSDLGIATVWIPLLWSGLHVVKVASSLLGGALSDRVGRRMMIGLGWLTYVGVYLGFGLSDSPVVVIVLFLLYGLHFGLTEGAEKAWVADMAPRAARGTAFGIYNAALGIGALTASLLFGLIWTRVSPHAAFLAGASLALLATVLLHVLFREPAVATTS